MTFGEILNIPTTAYYNDILDFMDVDFIVPFNM